MTLKSTVRHPGPSLPPTTKWTALLCHILEPKSGSHDHSWTCQSRGPEWTLMFAYSGKQSGAASLPPCYRQCLRCQPLLTLCLLATHRQHRISSSALWKTKRSSGLTTLVTFPWSVISEGVSPHYKSQRRLRSLVFVIYDFKIILSASSTRHTAQYGTSVPSSPRKRLTYVSFYFFFSMKKLRKYSMLT